MKLAPQISLKESHLGLAPFIAARVYLQPGGVDHFLSRTVFAIRRQDKAAALVYS